MDISVVIPIHNEEDNIAALIRECSEVFSPQFVFEIIVVNDGSLDQSATILSELQKENAWLRVIHHAKKSGQSAAVLTGVKAAKFEWVATLDGDGQNDPSDILNFIRIAKKINSKKWLCIGHREKRQDNRFRKISSKIANTVRQFILNDKNPDSACGIKLFPKTFFLQLPHFRNDHRFLPAIFSAAGAQVHSITVNHRQRLHGNSKYGLINRLGTGIIDLLGVAWLLRRNIDVESTENDKQSEWR